MFIRNSVTQSADIKKILTTLCDDYPIQCDKQNISGVFSNERVIVVKDHHFEYYDKPKKFKNGNSQILTNNLFKGKVKLTDIYELHFLPERGREKKSIKLLIPYSLIVSTNVQKYKGIEAEIEKNSANKEAQKNKEIIEWVFTFSFDPKAQIIRKIEEDEKRKLEQMIKVNPYDIQGEMEDNLNNTKKTEQIEINAEQELNKNLVKLKEVKQFIDFRQKLERQQQQRQNMIKLSLNLRRMQKGQVVQQTQQQQEVEVFPIRDSWKDYWKLYEKAAKCIGQQISKQYLQKQLMVLGDLYKMEQQIKFIYQEYINFKLVGWGPDRTFYEDFQFYKGVWIKLGDKQLNQQFITNNYLADLMYILKNSDKVKFRIPPLFLMNYKGFKAIVRIDLPFSTIKSLSKEVYCVKAKSSNFDIELIGKIKQALWKYERILNIKFDKFTYQQKTDIDAPLGYDIKIFEYDNKFDENTANYLENFYYIINIKGVFPIDYQFQKTPHPEYFLRPEIIAEYRDFMQSQHRDDYQLLTQAFMSSTSSIQSKHNQERKVIEVSQDFIPMKIKQLMNQFTQINLIMVDSFSIKRYMSEMGINARYLGHMYRQTEIPYLQQTLEVEMYARIIKNIYCQLTKDLVSNQHFFKRERYLKKEKDLLIQFMNRHNDQMVNSAIDFLNLVFGIGTETNQFWQIVLKKVKDKFNLEFTFPLKCRPGCLLHAVLWHCKFLISFELDIKLFEVEKPFEKNKNWIDFRLESKSFTFPSFEINKILKKLAVVDDRVGGSDDLQKHVIALLKLQLLHNNHCFGLDFRTQMTLAKLNNKVPNLQKPIRQCSYHPSQLPYYFTNKSHQNFKKALDIISFSLALNHPLFISLYDSYSSEFEQQLLQKATLLSAIKALGQFHPRTTQLYSKYYRQGQQKFQVKAKRSEETEAALIICQQLVEKGKFERCLNFTFERIRLRKQRPSPKSNDLRLYLNILKHGLTCSVRTRFYQRGLQIAEEYSEMINTYKIRTFDDHELLLKNALIIKLNLTKQRYYIYKLVLLVIKIQQQHEPNLLVDEDGLKLPRPQAERSKILMAIMNQYYLRETHSKWIEYILFTLKRGEPYFKHLNDLFNNYKYHINKFNMQQFQDALGYLDVLVRFFGQKLFYDNLYEVS